MQAESLPARCRSDASMDRAVLAWTELWRINYLCGIARIAGPPIETDVELRTAEEARQVTKSQIVHASKWTEPGTASLATEYLEAGRSD